MTVVVSIADFRAEHPEYDCFPDAKLQAYLDDAHTQCPERVWNASRRVRGVKFYTAHLIELFNIQLGQKAAIANIQRGSNPSVPNYGGTAADPLDLTTPGLNFKRLRSQIFTMGQIVR